MEAMAKAAVVGFAAAVKQVVVGDGGRGGKGG